MFKRGDIVEAKNIELVILVTGENKKDSGCFKGVVVDTGKSAYNVFYYSKYWYKDRFTKTNYKIKLIKGDDYETTKKRKNRKATGKV